MCVCLGLKACYNITGIWVVELITSSRRYIIYKFLGTLSSKLYSWPLDREDWKVCLLSFFKRKVISCKCQIMLIEDVGRTRWADRCKILLRNWRRNDLVFLCTLPLIGIIKTNFSYLFKASFGECDDIHRYTGSTRYIWFDLKFMVLITM